MRLYLSGRILSTPSLHIYSGRLVSATTRCSTLSTGAFPGVSESKQHAGGDRDGLGHFTAPVCLCTRQQGFFCCFFFCCCSGFFF